MKARHQHRLANQRGQSIVEYLVVAAAIIGVVVLLGPAISGRVNTVTGTTVTKFDAANTAIDTGIAPGGRLDRF